MKYIYIFLFLIIFIFMSLQTWSGLPKSSTDDETIEQAINRLIAVHEADPNSHLGDGESLQAHKNADVIDHPAYSVIDDKNKINKFQVVSYFENMDIFSPSGNYFNYLGYAELYPNTTLNATAWLGNPSDDLNGLTPDETGNPIFEFVGETYSNGNYEAYFGMGELADVYGVGFKNVGTSIYAMWHDDDEVAHTSLINGISSHAVHKYRVEVEYNVEVRWYIDNNLVLTVPYEGNSFNIHGGGMMFSFYIKNLTTGQVARFSMYRILFQQDLFE